MADNPRPEFKIIYEYQRAIYFSSTLSLEGISKTSNKKGFDSSSVQPKVTRTAKVRLYFLDPNGKPVYLPYRPFSNKSYLIMCSRRLACLGRT